MSYLQYHPENITWCSPLEMASRINENFFVLLYSGVKTSYSGRYSFLACDLREQIISDNFSEFAKKLSASQPLFANAWFGYLGYGLKNTLEELEQDQDDWLNMPALHMLRFGNIYVFDHDTETLTLWSSLRGGNADVAIQRPHYADATGLQRFARNDEAIKLTSNMTRAEYLQKAKYIIDKIHAGDLYQANLTRKFYGEFVETPNHFQIFEKLCAASPAPYSAFIKLGDTFIVSSSPESFLSIDAQGNITTRPIKGTAPRGNDENNERKELSESEKDRAENLMIVDLMRNDLARCCVTGSVKTDSLFDVTTHATIHHLSSTISGKKLPECSTLDAVKATFPPGSMTGAPKISAMNLCSQLEQQQRGAYSGAIGWFGGDGSAELSVVIRTLIIRGNKFEFQVGGGIVADSTPASELTELISKARGILLALDIPTSTIEKI